MATIFAAALLAVSTQAVKDFVEVDGARSNPLRGYGIVTGLNGRGDSPQGESARLLRAMLQNLSAPEVTIEKIEARNAALVLVTAELPPFQKPGTRLDVTVSAIGDARSLAGGELQLTDLRGPLGRRDPTIYALASGRLVVEGDEGRGNPTVGFIPGGAIVEKGLAHAFIHEIPEGRPGAGRKAFRLLLKKPDLSTAGRLVQQINASAAAGSGGRLEVAEALDGGAILVRIPTAEEYRAATGSAPACDFEREPVHWLDAILNLPADLYAPEAAAVVIHDASRTVSWTGEVRLRSGSVLLPGSGEAARPSVFHARDGQRLSEFLEKVGPAVTSAQLVDLVRALHKAGLIQAEVRAR
jgi:flagellar P-ring protein precursor FlgI